MTTHPDPIPVSLEHDAPLVALVGRSPHEMDDDELRQYIATLREVRATPQTKIAAVRHKSAKKNATPDLSIYT